MVNLIAIASLVVSSTIQFVPRVASFFQLSSGNFTQVSDSNISQNSMKNYFYYLDSNMTNNTAGCCSYVALEMLLSYYHVNVSSLVSDDAYIQNSSGTSATAMSQVSPGADPFPYLSMLVYDYHYFYTMNMANSPYIFGKLLAASDAANLFGRQWHELELNDNEMGTVLSNYLSNYTTGLSYTVASMTQLNNASTEAQRIQFLVNEIDAGRPVVVGLYDYYGSQNPGHACVAYDYTVDGSGNYTFYYNCGWAGSGKTHAAPSTSLFIFDVVSLQITSQHAHSYSYTLNNVDVCACQVISAHPNHTHHHIHHYQQHTAMKHYAFCMCDHYIQQYHSFIYDPLLDHCDFCGALA